jgi:hypothetical protein
MGPQGRPRTAGRRRRRRSGRSAQFCSEVARPRGFEPLTFAFGGHITKPIYGLPDWSTPCRPSCAQGLTGCLSTLLISPRPHAVSRTSQIAPAEVRASASIHEGRSSGRRAIGFGAAWPKSSCVADDVGAAWVWGALIPPPVGCAKTCSSTRRPPLSSIQTSRPFSR